MTIDTITREALVEKLKQYPTLLQQFLVLVDTQGTTLDDIQEILKKAEEAESNAVKAQASATIAQEEAEKSSTSASKVDAFDERIINLEKSTAKVKEENTFTQVNNFNSGIKSDKFKTSGGLDIINHDGTNINIGNSSKTLKLTGSQSRPTYKEQDIALLADVNSSLTTAIRYTDTETTERKAQDTALQTNIDKKANTTDLDTLKSSVNSNWSTLMANLGIGRWSNQTFCDFPWGGTGKFYDNLAPYYTSYVRMFAYSKFNTSEDIILQNDYTSGGSATYMFYNSPATGTLLFKNIKFDDVTYMCMQSFFSKILIEDNASCKLGNNLSNAFADCPNLIEIGNFDVSNVNYSFSDFIRNSPKVKRIGFKHIKKSINISPSTAFDASDLVEIISNLDPVTTAQTLTMGATNLAKLTDEEKQVATDKGWILA